MKRIVAIAAAILAVAAALIAISTHSGRADAASGSSITVDKKISASGHGSATTAAFSAPADTLVAFVATDGNAGQTVKVSGAGLTWTLAERSNAQLGDAEIWTATASSALSNVTVKSTPTQSGFYERLTVVAFGNANGIGSVSAASGPTGTGAPTISLTVQQAGSLTYAVGEDWDNATARTVASDQTLVDQYLAPSGDTQWTQSSTAGTSTAGQVVTLSDTAPTADRWDLSSVEILQGVAPQPSSSAPSSSPAPTSSAPSSSSAPPSSSAPAPSSSAPPPPAGNFPDASTTGVPAGTTLKDVAGQSGTGWSADSSGNVTVTANNATVDGYLIEGRVDASNVSGFTLADSKVECIGEDSWCVNLNTSSTIRDTEIGGRGCSAADLAAHLTKCYGYAAGVYSGTTSATQNTLLRDNIHSLTRALQNDGGTTIQDSYFHDSVFDCAIQSGATVCGLHSSASFMSKGHGAKYLHNTLEDGSSAVIFGQVYDNDGSTLGDVTIDDNRFIATTEPNGYTSSFGVSIENKHIDVPSSIRITNNVFDADPWDVGPWRDDGIGYTITGNVIVPPGSPINPTSAPSSSPPTTTAATTTAASSSASPTPTPTSSAPTSAFPDASTTGVPAGVPLQTVNQNSSGPGWQGDASGNVLISADNAVIDGYLIPGRVDFQNHNYITLKNSKVECIGEDYWCVTLGDKSVVSDVEIGGKGCTDAQLAALDTACYGTAAGIWSGPSTTANQNKIIRANIHSLTRAVQLDGNTAISDSWFHQSTFDCATTNSGVTCGNHSSATFIGQGPGVSIVHNTLSDGSSAVLFGQTSAPNVMTDVNIDDNRIMFIPGSDGSSFGVSIENKQIVNPASIRITNNVFDATGWQVGPWRDDGIGYTITGNTFVPTGSPINP